MRSTRAHRGILRFAQNDSGRLPGHLAKGNGRVGCDSILQSWTVWLRPSSCRNGGQRRGAHAGLYRNEEAYRETRTRGEVLNSSAALPRRSGAKASRAATCCASAKCAWIATGHGADSCGAVGPGVCHELSSVLRPPSARAVVGVVDDATFDPNGRVSTARKGCPSHERT